MKLLQIIIIAFIIFFCESCTPTTHVDGRYTNVFAEVAGEEFKFIQNSNTFEYYSRTEGATTRYSSGIWTQNKKTIFLNGFNDENIDLLNIESKFEEHPNENRNKIIVQYKSEPLNKFIKLDILLNENLQLRIMGDTTFFTDIPIRSLQVKSYLVHEGWLLAVPSIIDTLYSRKLEINNPDYHKVMSLKFGVTQDDFYRTKLRDSLTIKNSSTLVWHNREFKKIR